MLNSEILTQGVTIMFVGMSVVFSFLVILVFATLLSAKAVGILNKLCPLPEAAPKTSKKAISSDDEQVAVAIAVAMAQK